MTQHHPRPLLDAWLEESGELLDEASPTPAVVVEEDTLGPRDVGTRRCRLVLEADLELHVGRTAILGEQFVAIGLWQPSCRRYRDRVRLPSHRLDELIGHLAALRSFLGGSR